MTNRFSMWRKQLLLLFGLLLTTAAFAQSPAVEAVVKDIRVQYAEAMEMAQRQLSTEDEMVKSFTSSTLHYMIPACGPTTETLHFFYKLEDAEDPADYCNSLYLCTRRFNVAARQCYEEYLFDRQTHKPLFVYLRYETYQGENAVAEERYYFHDGQIIWKNINQYSENTNDHLILKTCSALMSAFTHLVNHNY